MTTNFGFTTRRPAPPLAQPGALATPARQPLGYPPAGDYAQGLAASLDAIRRNPPRTMPALGDDLLAEALLKYAQRNTAEGQAPPSAGDGSGGGVYGSGPALLGGLPSNISSTQTGEVSYGAGPRVAADPLKPYQDSSAWAAVMQRLRPQLGLDAGAGGGPVISGS
jgi:hypothetical protein